MENKERDRYYADIIAALAERTIKRLWIALILSIFLLVVTNAAWVWHESQFVDEITTEIEQDAENGTNYIVGGDFHGTAENQGDKDANP